MAPTPGARPRLGLCSQEPLSVGKVPATKFISTRGCMRAGVLPCWRLAPPPRGLPCLAVGVSQLGRHQVVGALDGFGVSGGWYVGGP